MPSFISCSGIFKGLEKEKGDLVIGLDELSRGQHPGFVLLVFLLY